MVLVDAEGRALSEEELRSTQGQAAAAVQLRSQSGAVTRCGVVASLLDECRCWVSQ